MFDKGLPILLKMKEDDKCNYHKGDSVSSIGMKNQIIGAILSLGVLTLPTNAVAVEQNQDEQCSKNILLSYFPDPFVKETLKRFDVPQKDWDAIVSELGVRDKEIIKQVEAKAEKITPNPLKDPQQRQAAVKIFRDTLLENFSAVMNVHGVKDEKKIQSMLDDIQQQKAKRFAQCMEAQRTPQANQKSTGASSSDQDDDDDYDDDDDNDYDDDTREDDRVRDNHHEDKDRDTKNKK